MLLYHINKAEKKRFLARFYFYIKDICLKEVISDFDSVAQGYSTVLVTMCSTAPTHGCMILDFPRVSFSHKSGEIRMQGVAPLY